MGHGEETAVARDGPRVSRPRAADAARPPYHVLVLGIRRRQNDRARGGQNLDRIKDVATRERLLSLDADMADKRTTRGRARVEVEPEVGVVVDPHHELRRDCVDRPPGGVDDSCYRCR